MVGEGVNSETHFKGRGHRIGNGLDKEDEREGRGKDNFKVSSL